jgi:transposase
MWHAGIDVSKARLDVYLLLEMDRPAQQAQFDNTPTGYRHLVKWLKRHTGGDGQLCLEATGVYGQAVTQYLYEQGIAVSVVNPARIKKYAESRLERHKTDQIDAKLIAIFCRKEAPDLWTPPPPELAALQALVRRRDDLLDLRQQERNRLEAAHDAAVRRSIEQHLHFIQTQIEQVEQAMHDHLDQHPDLKQQHDLLTSIPGLGDITACVLLAECRGITSFDNVRQLVAFAGLNPQQRQSGRMNFTAGISRMGRKSIRSALYMPALSAMRYNPLMVDFVERLRHNGLQGKQIVVAVMRKLIHLAYGVLKSGQPFDPHYAAKMAVTP